MIELRAHHLLCTVLYKGKGYSKDFVENMDQVVEALHNPDEMIRIKTEPDNICKDCPNAKTDGSCALDDPDKKKGDIGSLDRAVLSQYDIEAGVVYTSADIFSKAYAKVTKEFFDACCGECRWYACGLCDYEEYVNKLKKW